jgi:hypothetical protein
MAVDSLDNEEDRDGLRTVIETLRDNVERIKEWWEETHEWACKGEEVEAVPEGCAPAK